MYVSVGQLLHVASPLLVLYLPTAHAEHGPPSAPVYPALQAQAAEAELWLGEVELSGQPTHVAAAVAPTVTEYVPAPQSEQTALPAPVLYFPATHNAHAPAGPVLPAAQLNTHAANAVLPAGDTPPAPQDVHALASVAPAAPDHVPPTQSEHAALPLLNLYLPASHCVHAPAGPVLPAVHRLLQSSTKELELGEIEPSGHSKQVDDAFAPMAPEYVSVTHSVHATLPLVVLYLPASHSVHEPAGPVLPASHIS